MKWGFVDDSGVGLILFFAGVNGFVVVNDSVCFFLADFVVTSPGDSGFLHSDLSFFLPAEAEEFA